MRVRRLTRMAWLRGESRYGKATTEVELGVRPSRISPSGFRDRVPANFQERRQKLASIEAEVPDSRPSSSFASLGSKTSSSSGTLIETMADETWFLPVLISRRIAGCASSRTARADVRRRGKTVQAGVQLTFKWQGDRSLQGLDITRDSNEDLGRGVRPSRSERRAVLKRDARDADLSAVEGEETGDGHLLRASDGQVQMRKC